MNRVNGELGTLVDMTKIVLVTTVDRDIVVTSRRKVAEDVCKLQGTVTNVE